MISKHSALLALPTAAELRACADLCRMSGYHLTGFWAVWTPTAWSILMAYHIQHDISIQAVLSCLARYVPLCIGIQCFMMTFDDLMDYDLDLLVARTRSRPIPRGAISLPRAWMFFFLQAMVGLYCGKTYLSAASIHLSMMTWPILFTYPTYKRWTSLAPIPLGVVFNIGTCMGWSDISTSPQIDWPVVLPLYLAACMWTVCYETIYQHQDRADDEKAGIYSMARLCGDWTISVCMATGMGYFAILGFLGIKNGHGAQFFFAVALAGWLVLRRLLRTDINRPESCREFFLGMPFISQLGLVGLASDVISHRLFHGIPL
ncbi:hypothetical protein EVG20_g4600 [Dentipellis fragilis]|uniref:Uncharacterized protein n=1 Tax=Dentipellis fragilis TaxID=205917 RepID=A0A4Y9YXY1_9AGAM|nr:hypothetical protein EVG20_g4600 [Dentipellis fragilis]